MVLKSQVELFVKFYTTYVYTWHDQFHLTYLTSLIPLESWCVRGSDMYYAGSVFGRDIQVVKDVVFDAGSFQLGDSWNSEEISRVLDFGVIS